MYFVVGLEGKEYGPAKMHQLRAWVAERRIMPSTMLRDERSHETVLAGSLSDLFPQSTRAMVDPAPVSQDRYEPKVYSSLKFLTKAEDAFPWGSIVRSFLAVALFWVLQGVGLIFGVFALITAVQCQRQGNKYGSLAIGVAVLALLVVGIGWFLRVQGA